EDGSEPIHAPVLVRPITLRLRGNAREDVDLEIDATADLNPVLLRSLREAGVAVDARALLATTDSSHGFDPTPVLDAFRALGQPLPGFRISHALVVGNLMDAAGTVAEDLTADRSDWVDSSVVAALSGDEAARGEVLETAQAEVPRSPRRSSWRRWTRTTAPSWTACWPGRTSQWPPRLAPTAWISSWTWSRSSTPADAACWWSPSAAATSPSWWRS